MTAAEVALVIVFTGLGALLQGSTGIGITLIAGPVLVTIDPGFTPAPLLMASQLVGLRHVVAERAHTDRRAVGRCLLGLPLGVAAALAVVAAVDESARALLVGGATVVACAALLAGVRPSRTPRTETVGGASIAFAAVTASLPGPPAAITFNDMEPSALRGTLGSYMMFVSTIGLTGLALTGSFGLAELRLIAYLLPGVALGLLIARHVRHRLDQNWFRPAVLTVALCGGLVLVGRELLG
ncbi:MAG: sulfite exporter TauE/SafE family protein [Actinomycetota bacterium]